MKKQINNPTETSAATAPVIPAAPDAMKIEMWPIDRPRPYPKNARIWSAEAIVKCAASIKEFGFRQPIVADKEDVIVIGHLRQAAARYLGMQFVPIHVASDLSPEQIQALRIADNRVHEESAWDSQLLGVELIDLKVANYDLDITGFETEEIINNVFGDGGKRRKEKKGNTREAEAGSDETSKLTIKFEVLVECESEERQIAALELLNGAGFICRAQL